MNTYNTMLIRGRSIIPGATQDDTPLHNAAVAVRNGRVDAVGNWDELRSQHPQADVLGSEQTIVIPGLINAHSHNSGVSHNLHGVADDVLEPWLFSNLAARPQDSYLGTLFRSILQLQSGVTSVVDMAFIDGAREEVEADIRQRLKAFDTAGIRAALAPMPTFTSFLVHGEGEDERFLNALPADLQKRARALLPLRSALAPEVYLSAIEELQRDVQDHPRLALWFGPSGLQWAGDELMQKIAQAAERLDTRIQTHVVESFYEKLYGPRAYGKPTVHRLRELGVLGKRFTMAHGVWLTEAEIAILAETGAAVSHNPSSNLRLRAGIAPLQRMLQAGVCVGLGMDATTINDDEDMFNEMRLALRLQRLPTLDAEVPTTRDIFRMATSGGAALLGRDRDLGRLAPGYQADLVLLRLERLAWPWTAPELDPLDLVVLRAKASDVDTVLVGGNVVVQDGQPTEVDLTAIGDELGAKLRDTPMDEEMQRLVAEVRPYLKQWYLDWEVPELEPYGIYNSKR